MVCYYPNYKIQNLDSFLVDSSFPSDAVVGDHAVQSIYIAWFQLALRSFYKAMIQSSLSHSPQKTSVISDRQSFGRRSPIPCRQNALWKIESGVVRSFTWLEDGTSVTLGLWTAEDIVGRVLSRIDPYQLECLTPVEAILLPNLHLSQMTDQLIAHVCQLEELTVIRSHRKVEDMLLKLLNWLAKRFGHPVEQGNVIDLRLTHQDLADLLASTRVTITRLLNQFEQQGLIQRLPRQLIVLQADELWHYEI